jgi:hypothetical protein
MAAPTLVNCATQSLSGEVSHIPESVLAQVMQGDALRHEATGHSYHTRKRWDERCAKRGDDSQEICKRPRFEGGQGDFELPPQGQPLPACKEDVQQAMSRIETEFIRRVKAGYRHHSALSEECQNESLRRDNNGLNLTQSNQLMIPDHDGLRQECLHSEHAHPYAGHYGIHRTLKKAQTIYFWPKMHSTVGQFVRHCESCQRVQFERKKPQGALHPLAIPQRRWESISMDLIIDLSITLRGHDSIVVFVDRLSKTMHAAACTKTVSAERLAGIFEH